MNSRPPGPALLSFAVLALLSAPALAAAPQAVPAAQIGTLAKLDAEEGQQLPLNRATARELHLAPAGRMLVVNVLSAHAPGDTDLTGHYFAVLPDGGYLFSSVRDDGRNYRMDMNRLDKDQNLVGTRTWFHFLALGPERGITTTSGLECSMTNSGRKPPLGFVLKSAGLRPCADESGAICAPGDRVGDMG